MRWRLAVELLVVVVDVEAVEGRGGNVSMSGGTGRFGGRSRLDVGRVW